MNDSLQKALEVLLGKAINGIQEGVTFLSDQIPDVIRQLLLWHMVMSGLLCFTCVCMVIISLKTWKKSWALTKEWDGPVILLNVIALFVFVPGICFNMQWLQIWIAPKIFLIEYAAMLFHK